MPSAFDSIRQYLDGLVRRERSLLAGQAAAQVAAVAVGAVLLAAVWLSLGRSASETTAVVGALGGVGLLAALALPLGRRWTASGEVLEQAREVEAIAPELEHRLVTVVGRAELLESADPSRSPVLLRRAADQVSARLATVAPVQVHSSTPALRAVAAAVGVCLLSGLAQLLLPVGPLQALAAVRGDAAVVQPSDLPPPADASERAVVGDVVLRYIFPEYTGIEPVEVANSDGTIHAPAGTTVQVRARTARPFDRASLQIDAGAPQAAELIGGRDILAELVVAESGVWRFWLEDAEGRIPSKDFRLVVEEDAPPVVTLENGGATSVPHDKGIPVGWSVRDDFGIQRVVVEVTQGDETREVELRTPLDAPRDLRGALRVTPRELGIAPGETAQLKVVAYDNDVAGGNKRGESAEFEVTALGPRGRGQRLAGQLEALRDAMLPVLATFLVEEVPPGESVAEVRRWATQARGLYEPVRELAEAGVGGPPGTLQGDLVAGVLESGARLIRFSGTTWDPASTRRVTDGDVVRFADLHGEAVVALEKAIYIIDSLLVSAALSEVAAAAEDLAAEAQDLASQAADMEAAEILARLDKLDRTMAELARKAERVNEGALQEFLNGRLDDTKNLMEEIRKAVAEGRMDDAREMLEQLAEQVQQMAEGINDRMAAGQSGEDQLGEAAKKAMDDLEQLEADQRTLAEELEEKRQTLGEEFQEQLELWNRLHALAQEAAERGRGAVEATGDGLGWRGESVRSMETLSERTGGIADAVRARDLDRSAERVREAVRPTDMAQRIIQMELRRSRMDTEVPAGLPVARGHVDRVREILDEMLSVLDSLEERQQQDDPRMQQEAREMAGRQQELGERQKQLQREVQRVERALPTGDGEATEAMQRAGEAMDRAEGALDQGEAMAGEGHQREAAERVGEARQRLGQQLQQMEQMQQARGQMQGQQQGQPGDGDEEMSRQEQSSIDIPAPEDFQTPEAYRRALLEGMSGDVPEEYRSMKQQYFEELVRQ